MDYKDQIKELGIGLKLKKLNSMAGIFEDTANSFIALQNQRFRAWRDSPECDVVDHPEFHWVQKMGNTINALNDAARCLRTAYTLLEEGKQMGFL